MDKDLINTKLERLRRCVERIRAKTPATQEALFQDYDLQDIICVNLERAVQVCVDLASHLIAESEQSVQLIKKRNQGTQGTLISANPR